MKAFFAVLSLATSLASCAAPYATQGRDFNGFDNQRTAVGTVESVRVVRIERDIHAFEEALELRIQPDLSDQLVIRLDDGRAVIVMVKGINSFEAGQRVRLQSYTYGPDGPQVDHE